jgi:hypothetical protein
MKAGCECGNTSKISKEENLQYAGEICLSHDTQNFRGIHFLSGTN